ncbi:TPA: helix-turn-helix domain-containing protein [Escherichia coli]|nr:helix-turn-helix domain-containing protein [Escherichia coli]HAX5186606.1 helix-turn-helix domain-containing protein [Escherichia coli]HAX5233346.1 helix-turn-helix domain-containing protein [Escherichia coli]
MDTQNYSVCIYSSIYNVTINLTIPDVLSDAEKEILKCTMCGMNVTDIANYRFRSVKTVCFQKKQVYAKLGIKNDISFWLDLYMKYQLNFLSVLGDC